MPNTKHTFDVAIIGSGPAGATAAFELAKKGLSTVIIEKEFLPRYKTCGGGLVHRGRKLLPFDLATIVEKEFREVTVQVNQTQLTTHREEPIITMVMRDTFDEMIVKKAQEYGVTLWQGHKVVGIDFGAVQTITTSEATLQATFIIGADGALSPIAKMAGWKETRTLIPALEYEIEVSGADFQRLSQTVRFDVDAIPYGYGWCFPKKNHLSVGVAVLSTKHKKIDLKAYYREYLIQLGITTITKEAAHGFVIPISARTDGFVKNNVFLIGDAAGFADPLVAEGISNAILSGTLVAEAIAESGLDAKTAAVLYQQKLEVALLPEIKTGALLSKLFYEQKRFRNLLLPKYGQAFAEAMTDLFLGKRTYPTDYKAAINRKVKAMIFK